MNNDLRKYAYWLYVATSVLLAVIVINKLIKGEGIDAVNVSLLVFFSILAINAKRSKTPKK